jgi:hypothetical protein
MAAGARLTGKQSQVEGWILMAGGTFLRRTLEDIIDMTFLALNTCMGAIQLKGCQIMIKCGRLPA